MTYIRTPGQIIKHIYHVDTIQFNRKGQTSVFIYWDGKTCLLMDAGTSNDVETLFKNLNQIGIPYDKIVGIVVTHYHFDHAGGAPVLWQKLSKSNPNFKIFLSKDTYHKLQNAESHLIGAKTTYGDRVGEIPRLQQNAYTIMEQDLPLPIKLSDGYQMKLIATPGHTHDHCAPTLFKDDIPIFCFSGESCGALCRESKPVPMPTSMPPSFNFKKYMESCRKISLLSPEALGFCHFGAIIGKKEIAHYLAQHQNEMIQFREIVNRAYKEQPSTQYVVRQVLEFFEKQKTLSRYDSEPNSRNVIFAVTFGMMVDLGYRNPKYEQA